MSPTPNHKPQESKKQANQALKYSGMGIQLAIAIFLGAMIGKRLDAYMQTEKPIWTALLAVVFMGAMMYVILKDLMRKD